MASQSQPTFTIIVATYDSARTIQRCLESVVSQTFGGWELIVIDGGSSDGTVELLERFDTEIAFWISEPDDGVYSAWNKGLKAMKGEWVYFLGSDDMLHDAQVLTKVAEVAGTLSGSGNRVLYGQVEMVTETDETIEIKGEPWEDASNYFRTKGMSIPHQGCFVHRDLFEIHGPFDESYRISGDFEFLLRELKDHDPVYFPDPTVSKMTNQGISSQLSGQCEVIRETWRALETHIGRKPSLWERTKYWVLRLLAALSRLGLDYPVRLVMDLYLRAVGQEPRWARQRP